LALGHPNRWKILEELTCGETRTITELTKVAGCGYDNAAKHLQQLYRAGMVVSAPGQRWLITATAGCASTPSTPRAWVEKG